jgi:hypothetical protein
MFHRGGDQSGTPLEDRWEPSTSRVPTAPGTCVSIRMPRLGGRWVLLGAKTTAWPRRLAALAGLVDGWLGHGSAYRIVGHVARLGDPALSALLVTYTSFVLIGGFCHSVLTTRATQEQSWLLNGPEQLPEHDMLKRRAGGVLVVLGVAVTACGNEQKNQDSGCPGLWLPPRLRHSSFHSCLPPAT